MSENPAVHPPRYHRTGVALGRKERMLDAFARAPLGLVVSLLLLGAVLAGLQMVWIAAIHATGAAEPPQWLARLTVQQVNILVPLAAILLWSRRRVAQGRLGAIGAAMMSVLPVLHVFLTVCAIVWGGILGRGDMVYPFMYVEYLMVISLAGIFVSGAAWIRDRGVPRAIGPLLMIGLILNYVVPFGMLAAYIPLAIVVLRTGLVRRAAAPSSGTSASPAI